MAKPRPNLLQQLLRASEGEFSEELSNYLLSIKASAAEQKRCKTLSSIARSGRLTFEQQQELTEINTLNNLVMTLQAKARASLKRSPAA
jgi:hypothetical protein